MTIYNQACSDWNDVLACNIWLVFMPGSKSLPCFSDCFFLKFQCFRDAFDSQNWYEWFSHDFSFSFCFQRKELLGLLYTAFVYLLKLESFVTAWKKMLPVNFFLCIPQKKENHVDLNDIRVTKFHFGMNYAFKIPSPTIFKVFKSSLSCLGVKSLFPYSSMETSKIIFCACNTYAAG